MTQISTPGPSDARDDTPMLSVRDLSVRFPRSFGQTPVLDAISFDVRQGEAFGLVGESGCGKSLLSSAIIGLLPAAAKVEGEIMLEGRNLLALRPAERRSLFGTTVAMIYQDALSSLNPGMTIGAQLGQACRHLRRRQPSELLELVGLPASRTILDSYPHQLSGGQRQRALIALGLAGEPKLLIADEPTSALDVTVQAQIIDLLGQLRKDLGFSLIFVSHDLGVVAETTDRVGVMYAGQMVESGLTSRMLTAPRHQYSAGLIGASRSLEERRERLLQIAGNVPPPMAFPSGCRFRNRCFAASDLCATRPIREQSGDAMLACFHPHEGVAA